MGNPLRDMDKQQLLLEQILRVNTLAEANGIAPLNLGPLARMALPAAMKQVHDKNNEVIVALEGTPIPWSGPLKDSAAAAVILDQSMDYTDTIATTAEGGGYEGPLDIVSGAVVGYSSSRALRAAMLGQPAYTLKKLDGDAEPTQSFSYDGTTGLIDKPAITTFLDGDDGGLDLYNDHSTSVADAMPGNQVWNANGSEPPTFTTAGGANFNNFFDIPGGARTYVLVLDYVEDDIEFGPQLFTHWLGDVRIVEFKTYYAVQDDIWVDIRSADGLTRTQWATSSTLATGRHAVELQFDALGNLSVLVDGVDMGATRVEGELLVLPAAAGGFMEFPAHADPALNFYEAIIWPQQAITSPCRANIAAFYA